jgi:hypothetical protein
MAILVQKALGLGVEADISFHKPEILAEFCLRLELSVHSV